MKAVAYCATRNLYEPLAVAVYSLLHNTPSIDRAYLFLEDDEFPLLQDDRIKVLNVDHEHKYLRQTSPHYKSVFTYMALVRLTFTKYLPRVNKLLYLDVDTIVDRDISALWKIDLTDYAVASVPELHHCLEQGKPYVNSGVSLFNLKYLREHGLDDKMLEMINNGEKLAFCDQDAINIVCENKIYFLDDTYNEIFNATKSSFTPHIVHYAGWHDWYSENCNIPRAEFYRKYKDMMGSCP